MVRPRSRRSRLQSQFSPPAWGWSVSSWLRGESGWVFPTRVGMVRRSSSPATPSGGFPHPRGDGPSALKDEHGVEEFSPPAWGWSGGALRSMRQARFSPPAWGWSGHHRAAALRPKFSPPAWGWSGSCRPGAPRAVVFPTRVGMVRIRWRETGPREGFPHPRGDGPPSALPDWVLRAFSPPAWGWSERRERREAREAVFPTRVGMVRDGKQLRGNHVGFPHPRGDGPFASMFGPMLVRFSPPAWGWSGEATDPGDQRSRFPHPRGDGPGLTPETLLILEFSPPAWGWSAKIQGKIDEGYVFPTRVGMVRIRLFCDPVRASFPHPRGDGPPPSRNTPDGPVFSPPAWGWSVLEAVCRRRATAFSPPAWGWSDQSPIAAPHHHVFPTRVGMVRPSPSGCATAASFPHPRGDGPSNTHASSNG